MATQIFFVAGATGFTGRRVVAEARERGISVVAHIRPGSARGDVWSERFAEQGATVDRSPWEPRALEAALAAHVPTHVFGLLGTTRKRAKQEQIGGDPYVEIDYGLTAMLLAAASEIEPGPRFVYLSSMGVSERARGSYLQARARLERELRASGLPYTIARPSFITGERDELRPGERIGSVLADGVLGIFGALGGKTLRERYRSTTDVVLARALIDAALDPAMDGATLESDALQRMGRA